MRIFSSQRSSLSFAGLAALLLAAPSALAQAPAAPPAAPPPAAPLAPAEPAAAAPPPASPPAPTEAPAAAAQNARQAAEQPTEVVISATRSARDPFNTPTAITAVRAHEMARHPSASTAEQLRDTPGVWGGEGFSFSTPIIRGLTGNQTLVMVDGVRMNTATAFGGDNRIFQMFDVEFIDRMEVVRGPSSVLWGTDALGGMVHVFTKAPPAWVEEGSRFEGKISGSLGSVNAMQRFHGEAGVATKYVRARAGFTSLFVGDLQTPGPLGVMSPSGWKGRSFDSRIDFRPRPTDVISVLVQNQELRDAQTYDLAFSRPLSMDASRILGILRFEHNPDWVGASKAYDYVRDWQAQVSVHRQNEVTRNMLNGQDSLSQSLSFAADVQAHAPVFSMLDLTYGAHVHGDLVESVVNNGVKRTRGFPTSGWETGAVFLSADFRPSRWISILGGARADVFRLNSSPDELSVPKGLTIEQLRLSQTNGAVTGSLGAVGHLLPWLNVVASVARGYRAPNVNDQLSSGAFRAGYNFPSPGLSPESSLTLEGGLRVKVPKLLKVELNGWYTFFTNSITSVLRNPDVNSDDCVDVNGNGKCDPNEHVFIKNNLGKSHNAGVELSASVNLPYHFTPYVVGTWMSSGDDGTAARGFTPPTNGTIGVRFEPTSPKLYIEPYVRLVAPISASDISCARIFTDGGYRVDPRDPKSPLLGTLKLSDDNKTCSGTYPGHATLGIRGGATLTSFLDVALEVRNVTNASYRDQPVRYDGGGIGAFGTLTLHQVDE